MRYTLNKTDRLKSRKTIERLFREGQRFSVYPFKIFYLAGPSAAVPTPASPPPAAAPPPSDVPAPTSPSAAVPPPATPSSTTAAPSLQAGFGVSSRLFRKAVDRNRIKRLSREAWRLQRHALSDHLHQQGRVMAVFILYTGKQLPELPLVTQKIGVALQKLLKEG